MLLSGNFYKISELTEPEPGYIRAKIHLNDKHEIFSGHFPENPVTPGVVSIQMVSEILGFHLKKNFFLSEASNIKFPAMIQPENTPEPVLEIKFEELPENRIKISAKIFTAETIFLKLNGIFNY